MKDFNVNLPSFKDQSFNIVDFGAKEGGSENVAKAINEAIIKCNEAGGGKVIIPTGLWLTGPIEFKSDVCLFLEDGAYVIFSKSSEEYPVYVGDWEGTKRVRAKSQITAHNCHNIAIIGRGIMDAQGDLWRGVKKWKLTEKEWQNRLKISPYVQKMKETEIWYPTKTAYEGALKGETFDLEEAQKNYDLYRPAFVSIVNCDTVLLEGATFQNSASWNVHPLFTSNLTIRNCVIRNPYHAQNGDGLDIESCNNVEVSHTTFAVGDDGICIKSGKNKEARAIKKPSYNIYIHDCNVFEAHGGFVVGSEMSRGVNNVLCENCNFIGTDVGIRFKSSMGRGGVVSDITLNNIRMTNIKEEAIIFTMGYALTTLGVEGVEKLVNESMEDVPEFKNVKITNTICTSAKKGLVINGLDLLPIHDITLENVKISCNKGLELERYKNIILKNTDIIENGNLTHYKEEILC
ncbi:MAG: glycoside hydrolase family 28 protein [Anaeroplasmataceae bacterium]